MEASWWTLGSSALIALLVLAIWSIRRHRDPKLNIHSDQPIQDLTLSLAGLTLGTPVSGSSAQLLENGAFFDVLLERIGAARKTVHFETFLWKDGELGRRMAAAFCERARAGCKVRIMLDDTGSRKIREDVVEQIREAGGEVRFFHKRSLRNLGVLNNRDHRKLCILDGREAFAGGHCVTDEWLGNAEDGKHFSDLSVWLHGPIVGSLQSAFSENWAGETGELFVGDDVFPKQERAGEVVMHVAFSKPENSAPAVKILHHTAICLARKRIWIQNPYFIPEPDAIEAFAKAVERGVDVRVLMPATSGSDNPIVQYAGPPQLRAPAARGRRLYEYPHTLLHQKVMTSTAPGRRSAAATSTTGPSRPTTRAPSRSAATPWRASSTPCSRSTPRAPTASNSSAGRRGRGGTGPARAPSTWPSRCCEAPPGRFGPTGVE